MTLAESEGSGCAEWWVVGAGNKRKALKVIGNPIYLTRSEGAQGGDSEKGGTIKLLG